MKIFRTNAGTIIEHKGGQSLIPHHDWDELFRQDDLQSYLEQQLNSTDVANRNAAPISPVSGQEIWAAGVTYFRSRDARMSESEQAGGGDFYDRVYAAERPELFYKGSARTVAHPQGSVYIRADSAWNVPEPELVLAIDNSGRIFGYTIGNDMSSRDIEGENPLYLPQAKIYNGSSSLGPGILISNSTPDSSTKICMEIVREDVAIFNGITTVGELKRTPQDLVRYLCRHNSFPHGCFLMTGTGIVPPDNFTLQANDHIAITIESIGTLTNTVDTWSSIDD